MPQGTRDISSNNQKKVAQNPGTSFLSASLDTIALSSLSVPPHLHGEWGKRISFNDTVRYSEVPGLSHSNAVILSIIYPRAFREEMSQSCKEKQIFEAALSESFPLEGSSSQNKDSWGVLSVWGQCPYVGDLIAEDMGSAGVQLSTLTVILWRPTVLKAIKAIGRWGKQYSPSWLAKPISCLKILYGNKTWSWKWVIQDATNY